MTDRAATTDPGWLLCPGCRSMLYRKRYERLHKVCPDCGHHGQMTAGERIASLFDQGSVRPLDVSVEPTDPLGFVDTVAYPTRLRSAQRRTGLREAVVCVRGTIGGSPVVAAVMDFRFLGGSLGSATGELVTLAAEEALRTRTPLLIVCASGGARMQEGVLSLMQMAKTSQALLALDQAGVLTVSLITDPTYGGVAASFATLCDVIIAEPGARMGFAGPRVIAQTVRETLPPGFQTAEFLAERGMIDIVCPRGELPVVLSRLLSLGGAATAEPVPHEPVEVSPVVANPDDMSDRDPWDAVRAARIVNRPTTLDLCALMLDEFVELRGDRIGADCPAIVGGLGRLAGMPVMVVGHEKGRTAQELATRNYGMAEPSGYRKAARLMRLAEKLDLPLITLINTPGAYPGVAAEEQGQAVAIAENLRLMAGLRIPTVAVITGEGGSGGALALAIADRVYACANAVYSVISPEGCAAILWNDAAAAPKAARALRVDAYHLLRLGVVDGVIPEPGEGAHTDHPQAARMIAAALAAAVRDLRRMDPGYRLDQRWRRYRAFGLESSVAATTGAKPAGAAVERSWPGSAQP
ncbi:MAG TPA: acetyl-CoA carboxylase, carboxyltransferase subunit beta [Micromonospora sp.]